MREIDEREYGDGEAEDAYERHVAVHCGDAPGVLRLGARAAAARPEAIHLVPARGRMVSQPMPTLRDREGYAAQRAAADGLVARLRADGFDPARVKIETAPWSPYTPKVADGYFEHHLEPLLDAEFDRAALTALAVRDHGGTVTWRARWARERRSRSSSTECEPAEDDRPCRRPPGQAPRGPRKSTEVTRA
ncbi:hypothetical protein J7E88_34810 [Streptomyces sp. ISL-10]|uniref:hypothetical protein n=1 Tax=Streptomyces sp. ISL-10 TaxID=2819172 RepID=UPI001BE7916F|nr:hypothetical protein [Streptomyces sp. ISL-10]MBT2370308.1 hypothetical protein [Streptomyces sp. ISL-10]